MLSQLRETNGGSWRTDNLAWRTEGSVGSRCQINFDATPFRFKAASQDGPLNHALALA